MKQVFSQTSTYSADLFGINSALYELGGLIVMHDASGCNSTYNTHDEPRWYTMDSMVYVSGLTERDAILGCDDRLINDVVRVAEREHPKFIALSLSVLPAYMGTDLRGIAHVIEKRTGIPTFGFMTNGMDSYVIGAGMAYLAIAKRFCHASECGRQTEDQKTVRDARRIRVNLIGVTPLDFSVSGNVEALRAFVYESGFELHSCWSMGCTLEELADAPSADVSLVVSSTGLPTAEYLYSEFGVPYVTGIPCGCEASDRLAGILADAAQNGQNKTLFEDQKSAKTEEKDEVLLIGEAFHCASLRYRLEHEYGFSDVRINCPLERDGSVLRTGDFHRADEAGIAGLIQQSEIVIADPVYRRITPDSVRFVNDPHDAYSGRMYHDCGWLFAGRRAEEFPGLEKI